MIHNEYNLTDTEIAELAAEFCYEPHSENNKRELAAAWLIEYLAMPKAVETYNKSELKDLIIAAITQKQWKI